MLKRSQCFLSSVASFGGLLCDVWFVYSPVLVFESSRAFASDSFLAAVDGYTLILGAGRRNLARSIRSGPAALISSASLVLVFAAGLPVFSVGAALFFAPKLTSIAGFFLAGTLAVSWLVGATSFYPPVGGWVVVSLLICAWARSSMTLVMAASNSSKEIC